MNNRACQINSAVSLSGQTSILNSGADPHVTHLAWTRLGRPPSFTLTAALAGAYASPTRNSVLSN